MKNLKVAYKLIVSNGLIFLLVIILGVTSLIGVDEMANTSSLFTSTAVPIIDTIWEARRNSIAVGNSMLEEISTLNELELKEITAKREADSAAFIAALDKLSDASPAFVEKIDEIKKIIEKSQTSKSSISYYSSLLTAEDSQKAYEIYINEYDPLVEEVNAQLVEIYSMLMGSIEKDVASIQKAAITEKIAIFTVALIAIFITVICTVIVARSILIPLKEIQAATLNISKCNLDIDVKYRSKDELGSLAEALRICVRNLSGYISDISSILGAMANKNFNISISNHFIGDFEPIEEAMNKTASELSESLNQISVASDQVLAGSEQVAAGAQSLAQGSTEQASSVQEVSASIAEISSKISLNAENAKLASEKARNASNILDESNKEMMKLTASMADIDNKSKQIGKIIKTIEDIAFQTNILALNAAVEAARAGEAGRGFAVVADEVRNLAGKSADAATDTTVLIEDCIKAINEGVSFSTVTASKLFKGVTESDEVTKTINEISLASQQQAGVIAEITTGIDQISSIIQMNSATSEESAAASEELSSQATMLKGLISGFQIRD